MGVKFFHRTGLPLLLTIILAGTGLMATAITPVTWKLNSSSVTFKIKNAGLVVNGSLGGVQTDIQFDVKNPAQCFIVASLETSTIDTGISLRNKHLRKALYLDVDTYPRITMRSIRIEKMSDQQYTGYFNLTIKETTKNIKLPFTFTQDGHTGEFKGEFKINRLDYGIGESSWLMDNEVVIFIQINVSQ